MLVANPTQEQWAELKEKCIDGHDNLEHLMRYGYAGMRISGDALYNGMRDPRNPAKMWLIEADGHIVGFMNFGQVVPGQADAVGICIGLPYVRRGYARRSMLEFSEWCRKNGIREFHGYCNRNNKGSVGLMENLGMLKQPEFRDHADPDAVKYFWRVEAKG